MVQIYLLMVIGSLSGGMLMLAESVKEKVPSLMVFREWYNNNQALQPFLFCLFVVVGLLGCIVPYRGIPVLGDFIPALSNIVVGIGLFLEYYREKGRVVSETLGKIIVFFENYRGALGTVALIAGIAHFIFPGVIFL